MLKKPIAFFNNGIWELFFPGNFGSSLALEPIHAFLSRFFFFSLPVRLVQYMWTLGGKLYTLSLITCYEGLFCCFTGTHYHLFLSFRVRVWWQKIYPTEYGDQFRINGDNLLCMLHFHCSNQATVSLHSHATGFCFSFTNPLTHRFPNV